MTQSAKNSANRKQKRKKQSNKGFSLIEIIVAFAVLTVTILGASNLLSSSIQNGQENILRLQAYYLAQQGLEGVRNIRDSNWTQNLGFENSDERVWGGTIYPQTNKTSFTIEPIYSATSSIPLEGVLGAPWRITPRGSGDLFLTTEPDGTQHFTHGGGVETPFRRVITVSKDFEDMNKLINANRAEDNNNPSAERIEDNTLVVTSTTYFKFKGRERQISLTTLLTDWKEGPL